MAKIVQTAGRNALGTFAPDFARYNDDILFGEVWNDETLSPKTRSMIVLSIFMGRGLADSSLDAHLQMAKKHGMTKSEFVALVTQGGFYAGWPMAWALFNRGKAVWTEDDENPETPEQELTDTDKALADYAKTIFFPVGAPNDAYAKYFSGRSWLTPISGAPIAIANVTFEPGCKNNWHIHHADKGGGQVLIGVGGKGWYQAWGEEPVEITPGTVIEIPEGVKHWHGAADGCWFSHLAFEIPGENSSTEWLEPVED